MECDILMAVIITDIYMPNGCVDCEFSAPLPLDNTCLYCTRRPWEKVVAYGADIPDFCPLKPIDSDIDSDYEKLNKQYAALSHNYNMLLRDINLAMQKQIKGGQNIE